ncbi:MAG: tRNA pseudouridine(13) synthase TruD [Planctomycetes bacterium]|nr:tRNA pseudouridine(13) synthase TruD [Planctomycetota bacterium]
MFRFVNASHSPRYLTSDIPGIGGVLKAEIEDFVVEEVPLYEPCGSGEHVYFQIEKRDLSTFEAIGRVARALGVRPHEIGSAGLKDSRAVARQTLSVALVSPERVSQLAVPGVQVKWVTRHGNKLRIGHLRGNRFVIRVRGVRPGALDAARRTLAVLERRGVPNVFGPQRFGVKGDTDVVGRAFLHGDWKAALDAIVLGPDGPETPASVRDGRAAYREDRFADALGLLPQGYDTERGVVRALAESRGDAARAASRIPRNLRFLYLSAYQSRLFNLCLDRRLETIDRVGPGDLAYKHVNGAVFAVVDAAVEQPRADAFEISPSGPIFGYKMIRPTGLEAEIEDEVVAEEGGLDLQRFDGVFPGIRLKGERRAYRFPIRDVTVAEDGDALVLSFFLPRGCYATAVLRELMKTDTPTSPSELPEEPDEEPER